MMADFSWQEIVTIVGGTPLTSFKDASVSGISTDSRTLQSGELFIPIHGDNYDGHDYVEAAFEHGALGALIEPGKLDKPVKGQVLIQVENAKQAYADLARAWRQHFDIPVVGVTGSCGKSTVKEMIAALMQQRWNILKSPGSINNEIGVPQTVLKLEKTHQAAIFELGINAPHEMDFLCRVAQPTIGLITNVGPAHLEGLSSVQGVAQEKTELFRSLPKNGTAVFPAEDVHILPFLDSLEVRKISFGTTPRADVQLQTWKQSSVHHVDVELQWNGAPKQLRVRGFGRSTVLNVASALGVASALDLNWQEIEAGFASYQPLAMRMQPIEWKGAWLIHDAYNANPSSMDMALEAVAQSQLGGRRIAILGEMGELGPQSLQAHQSIAKSVAVHHFDHVIFNGTFANEMLRSAVDAGMDASTVLAMDHVNEMTSWLQHNIQAKDIVLIKASRVAALERIFSELGIGT